MLTATRESVITHQYRFIHLLVDLGWVDLALGVPLSAQLAQPLLPNSHQPSRADSGTLEIQVNKTQSQLTWDTLY